MCAWYYFLFCFVLCMCVYDTVFKP